MLLKLPRKGTRNENRNLDRTSSTWADLRCVWPQWFLEFPQHGADAFGIGRPVYRGTRTVSLLLGCRCAASCGWPAPARESVRAPWACASWTSDCEHYFISRVLESEWCSVSNRCSNPLGDCLLQPPPKLLRHICPTDVISNHPEITFTGNQVEVKGEHDYAVTGI